jgi:hypothetical protein
MSLYKYKLYNTTFRTDLSLPLLTSNLEPEIVLKSYKYKKIRRSKRLQIHTTNRHFIDDKIIGPSYYLNNKIIIPEFKNKSDISTLSVIKRVIPYYLSLKGKIFFHASAFAINSNGFIIIGKSGAGKSLLAAAMEENGAVHLADDQVNIEFLSSKPYITHSSEGKCLFKWCSKKFNLEDKNPDNNKIWLSPLENADLLEISEIKFPLKKIILLAEKSDLELEDSLAARFFLLSKSLSSSY